MSDESTSETGSGEATSPLGVDGVLRVVLQFTREMIRTGHSGMEQRQLALLLLTKETQYVTVRGAATFLAISKPAVSRAAQALVVIKYLRRVPDPRDARSIFLKITPQGRHFLRSMASAL